MYHQLTMLVCEDMSALAYDGSRKFLILLVMVCYLRVSNVSIPERATHQEAPSTYVGRADELLIERFDFGHGRWRKKR